MGKNVAVFVDVANIFYAAKAAGVDIDYVTLLKSATAGRDFVRAYAYTGLDPDNENQRNFHSFLARNHYKVVSKDIRKYGDGKVKANLDIELVVDMMKTSRNLDIAIVVSGDGDFAPAIRAVQEMGVRVEVISFRGNTSSDLIEVADLFTDITQLARVDKSSSRSGRRVAGDEEDLSMTEVPDKQTEGTGTRGRGRGRGRGRPGEAEPVAASGRGRSRTERPDRPTVAASSNGAGITVLPGEKLSRAGAGDEAAAGGAAGDLDVAAPGAEDDDEFEMLDALPVEGETETDEAGRRRRRRRGGRGRGRGRGRDEAVTGVAPVAGDPVAASDDDAETDDEEEDVPVPTAPRGPRSTPFGSFWDAQIGVPTSAPTTAGPVADDEDFDEPEIPEYLIAEQRRGRQQQQGRGGPRGPRGGRSAYTAAIERERYGGGGSRSGGINRYPDVSGRERQVSGGGGGGGGGGRASGGRPDRGGYGRPERQDRPERADRPARSGGDPWSEVPPELEEMLRAQLAQSGKGRPAAPQGRGTARNEGSGQPVGEAESASEAAAGDAAATGDEAAPTTRRRTPARRTTRSTAVATPDAGAGEAAATDAGEATASAEAAPAKRRTTRRSASTTADAAAADTGTGSSDAGAAGDDAAPAPKRRAPRRSAATGAASADPGDAAGGSAEGGAAGDASGADAAKPTRRRTTRKAAEPAES